MIIVSVAELIKYHSEVLSFKCNYLLMKCIPISHYYWFTATFPISLSSTYCYNYTLHLHNAINMGILAEAKKVQSVLYRLGNHRAPDPRFQETGLRFFLP